MDTEMNVDICLDFLRFALTDNSVVPDSVSNFLEKKISINIGYDIRRHLAEDKEDGSA